MSGNYTDVREMSGISLKVMEMSGNCQGKNLVMENVLCKCTTVFNHGFKQFSRDEDLCKFYVIDSLHWYM